MDMVTTHSAIIDNSEATAEDRNKYKMTSAESSNEQKDNIGIRWNHTTQAPTPAACGRGYSPLRITKKGPAVIFQTNSMHFMHPSTITTPYRV